MDREQSLIVHPLFDGTNYAYWQAVKIGQTKPKEASADWDEAKIKAANFNNRALNALFSAVINEEFKKISSTEIAQEA